MRQRRSKGPTNMLGTPNAPLMDEGREALPAYQAAGTLPTVMQAVYITKFGGELETGRIPVPAVLPDHVLVRVHAASFNPIDYKARDGGPSRLLFPSPTAAAPRVMGFDVSGEVVAVGKGVPSQWHVGAEVFAMNGKMQACAQYCAVHHSHLAGKPTNVTHVQAASIPLAGLTALQSLYRADVQAGYRVLITAGSGGVGTLAIQLARARGAHVITTCSPPRAELVTRLGAAEVINYRNQDFRKVLSGSPVDAAVDCTREYSKLLSVVKRRGRVASILALPSAQNLREASATYHAGTVPCCIPCCVSCLTCTAVALSPTQCCCGRRVEGVLATPRGDHLQLLADMITSGTLEPVVDRVYPFDQAAEALAYLEAGHAAGKVVVEIVPAAAAGAGAGAGAATVEPTPVGEAKE